MNHNLPNLDENFPRLGIFNEESEESSVDAQLDLHEEIQHLIEQAEVEEFWAGRNLAARKSTRQAA